MSSGAAIFTSPSFVDASANGRIEPLLKKPQPTLVFTILYEFMNPFTTKTLISGTRSQQIYCQSPPMVILRDEWLSTILITLNP